MQIQISRILQKSTDLNLHCLLRKGMTCLAKEGLNQKVMIIFLYLHKNISCGYSLEVPWCLTKALLRSSAKKYFYEEMRKMLCGQPISYDFFFFYFALEFKGPVNTIMVMSSRSVYLT